MVETILEAAARILETTGLDGFNTNAVAQRAGVSVGSLYQYFPGKAGLLAELIRRRRAKLVADLKDAGQFAEGRDLGSAVNGLIRAAIAHQLDRPRLATSLEYAEAMLPIDAETEALKRTITDIVAAALASHGVPDPETAARDLSAMTRGLVDAAGLAGETDVVSLEARLSRAIHGYLGADARA